MYKPSFSTTSAAMIALVLSVASASAKTTGTITAQSEAERTIESLDHSAVQVEARADELWMLAHDSQYNPESHANRLMALREEINKMSRELRSLEAERDTLSTWEQQAVAKTLPLVNDAAVNTERAFEDFNQKKPDLWIEPYRGYVESLREDSVQMVKTLKTYLQLAKLHDREQRLDHDVAQAGGE
jgi:chromosome segregation ATPase